MDAKFKVGQAVAHNGSLTTIKDIRMFDETVPTFCDGKFFDTHGPFCKVRTNLWVYEGNLLPLTPTEKGEGESA